MGDEDAEFEGDADDDDDGVSDSEQLGAPADGAALRIAALKLSGGVATALLTVTLQLQRRSSGAAKTILSSASIWQEGATRSSSTARVMEAMAATGRDDAPCGLQLPAHPLALTLNL